MEYCYLKSHDWCRDRLVKAINNNDSICVNGLPSTGKTTLVKMTLEDYPGCIYAYINCRYVSTASELYLKIIKTLAKGLSRKKIARKIPEQSIIFHNFHDIFCECKTISAGKGITKIYVVLDEVDILWRSHMLEAVSNLAIMNGMRLIFISCESAPDVVSYFKVCPIRARVQDKIVAIDLPPLSKEDAIKLILQEKPANCEDLYKKFVHNVVSVVYFNSTKDFIEIKAFCQEHFGKFLEFFRKKVGDRYRKLHPDSDTNDDEIDDFDIEPRQVTEIIASYTHSFREVARKDAMADWERTDIDNRVVLGTSVLIIAAYIAAHTKPLHDKRNFITLQKRTTKKASDKNTISASPFTLERLIQIYQRLFNRSKGISDCVEQSVYDYPDSILGDITTLENHNIVQIVGGNGLDSLTRYKINNSLQRTYVQRLADQVQVSLELNGL